MLTDKTGPQNDEVRKPNRIKDMMGRRKTDPKTISFPRIREKELIE